MRISIEEPVHCWRRNKQCLTNITQVRRLANTDQTIAIQIAAGISHQSRRPLVLGLGLHIGHRARHYAQIMINGQGKYSKNSIIMNIKN